MATPHLTTPSNTPTPTRDERLLILDAEIALAEAQVARFRTLRAIRNQRALAAQVESPLIVEGVSFTPSAAGVQGNQSLVEREQEMSTDVIQALNIFHYQSAQVRVVVDEAGEPWFVLSDLCKVLNLTAPHMVAKRIDDDFKGRSLISTPGGTQEMTTVNEAGMYDVILRSDKEEAKAFRRWITSEVLPTIRKTGGYGAPAPVLSGPELMAVALVEADRTLKAKDVVIAGLTGRAEVAERTVSAIEAAEGLTLRAFHKHYFSDVPEREFFETLYAKRLLIDQRGARRGPDGRPREGREHRHPTATGKRFFYLRGSLDGEGKRREHTRVRPGRPELDLVRYLHHRGLTPNANTLAVLTGTAGVAAGDYEGAEL